MYLYFFQIYEYIRTSDIARFYYSVFASDASRAPPNYMIIPRHARKMLHLLTGPAILYRKKIIIATHCYNNIPHDNVIVLVRL